MIYKKTKQHTSMLASVQALGATVRIMPLRKKLFTQLLQGGEMRKTLLLFATCFVFALSSLLVGSVLAYYYPPNNIPPGPPPNYNQVDTSYFKGTPSLPLPPPDSGGLYVYYDQGVWNVANHIYSAGYSLEQFHCCILAVMSQLPTLGVNVFIEQFELWGDTSNAQCLKQNDRWGWFPWGDSLYEIWWDVTTREWQSGLGDPNDFMRFRIAGRAVDFNFWSSGHWNLFGANQIFLGANKTPLSSVPGFTDTYPGMSDPYQSHAGNDPTNDPNITIFTQKSDTLRSYNKNGLIDSTDSYSCDLALQYGQRYAGTFAYEGDGIEFSALSFYPPYHNPNILLTPDTTVVFCVGDSVCLWIYASDPDPEDTITVEKVYGIGTYTPKTDLTPISDTYCFYPDTSGTYKFIFKVTDMHGATGYDTTDITVNLNRPPALTCPTDDSVHAGGNFVSADFVATDPDGNLLGVTLCGVTPIPSNMPTIISNHVEWQTACADAGKLFTFCLLATDNCGAKDTCEFQVTVYDQPPQITCPDDDTVDSGYYLSGDFTVDDPDGDSVTGIRAWVDPAGTGVTNLSAQGGTGAVPTTGHVEFDADSLFPGDYTVYLEATSGCEIKDTCFFLITILGRPPVITSTPDTTAFVGQLYTYHVDATGIPVPTFALITFPTGMTINPNSGVIQWTPTAVGDSNVCAEAVNSAGADTQCFTISVAESAQVSILPQSLFIRCDHEDTLWIHLDEKVVDMDSAFFKIAYEDTLITPDTVIKGPALVPPGNFDLSYGIYPDSILISLAVLSGSFDGPDTILGIVFTAGNYVTTAQVSIERSSLQNSEGEEIPHRTIGAEIQIDCPTSADGEDEESQNPSVYALGQNHPNPYNPVTQITYQLPQPGVVSLKIYNVQGQLVRTLVNEYKSAGTHSISWNGRSDLGMEVSSGIYLYRIQAGNFTDTKRMILIK